MSRNKYLDEFMATFPHEGLTFDDVSLVTQYADFLPAEADESVVSTAVDRIAKVIAADGGEVAELGRDGPDLVGRGPRRDSVDVGSTRGCPWRRRYSGRLAIRSDMQGQGLGRLLLADALNRAQSAAQSVGSAGIFVDAMLLVQ